MSRSYRKPYPKVELNDKSNEKSANNKKVRHTLGLINGCEYKKVNTLSWKDEMEWDIDYSDTTHLKRK